MTDEKRHINHPTKDQLMTSKMNHARSHARPVQTSRKRFSKIAEARDSLAEFGRGMEVDVMTFGQFSIIDAIEAVLEVTGPANVTLATWTAAHFDLSQIEAQVKSANILDLRLIIDRSFVTRHPRFVTVIHEKFGANSVRTTKTHAKFIVIHNAEWKVVIRTSMNLNFNPRLEYLQVSQDDDLADFYLGVADAIYGEIAPGMAQQRTLPELESIKGIKPTHAVSMGKLPTMGRSPRTGADQ